jgi:hypothetical protein
VKAVAGRGSIQTPDRVLTFRAAHGFPSALEPRGQTRRGRLCPPVPDQRRLLRSAPGLLVDGRLDNAAEPLKVHGLFYEGVEACVQLHIARGVARERNDGHPASPRLGPNPPEEFDTVHLRHGEIGDDHIDIGPSSKAGERSGSIPGGKNPRPASGQVRRSSASSMSSTTRTVSPERSSKPVWRITSRRRERLTPSTSWTSVGLRVIDDEHPRANRRRHVGQVGGRLAAAAVSLLLRHVELGENGPKSL